MGAAGRTPSRLLVDRESKRANYVFSVAAHLWKGEMGKGRRQ